MKLHHNHNSEHNASVHWDKDSEKQFKYFSTLKILTSVYEYFV